MSKEPSGAGISSTSQHPQGMQFGMPPAVPTRPSGVSRAVAMARGFSGQAVIVVIIALTLQATMSEGHRPSDLIGGFHGSTESAEMNAKRDAQATYERQVGDAKAAPPASWQMETQVNQTQQQAVADSLQAQAGMANLADIACIGSGFVTAFFGRDGEQLAQTMRGACGAGDRIRQNITGTLAETAKNGSGIMQRPAPVPAGGLR